MKYLYALLSLCLFASAACKKASGKPEAVAVIVEKAPGQNTYIAVLEFPEVSIFSFLCTIPQDEPRPEYSCSNSIYIRNLPASMTKAGTRVRFTTWTDYGQPLIYSSINHGHELDIKDLQLAE